MFRFTQTIIRELLTRALPSYDVDIGYIYRYLKLSVLWLHILSALLGVWIVHWAEWISAQCTVHMHNTTNR